MKNCLAFAVGVTIALVVGREAIGQQPATKHYNGKYFSFLYPAGLSLSEDGTRVTLRHSTQEIMLIFQIYPPTFNEGQLLKNYEDDAKQSATKNKLQIRIEHMNMSLGGSPGKAVHARLEGPDKVMINETTVAPIKFAGKPAWLAGSVISTAPPDGSVNEHAFALRKQIMDTFELPH